MLLFDKLLDVIFVKFVEFVEFMNGLIVEFVVIILVYTDV